jgi:hypothetical protein
MARVRRGLLLATSVVIGGTLLGRMLGYRIGGNTVVRCRRGHLFTTIWIPGVHLKEIDLGIARIQHCPVGHHWTLVRAVKDSALTEDELQEAHARHDIRIP